MIIILKGVYDINRNKHFKQKNLFALFYKLAVQIEKKIGPTTTNKKNWMNIQ